MEEHGSGSDRSNAPVKPATPCTFENKDEEYDIPVEDSEDALHQCGLLMLPNEVLEDICCHIDMRSLCSVSQSCWRLHNIQTADKVWKTAVFNRYPQLALANHQTELQSVLKEAGNSWQQLAAWRFSVGVAVRKMLDEMGSKYYSIGGLPDPAMQEMKALVSEHCTLLIKDELLEVLDTEHTDGFEHISRRYYARMLYRELHRDLVLLPLFREFMQRPSEHTNVSEAMHLISMWIIPERRRRSVSELKSHYERIAAMCLHQLRSACPDHPAAGWTACKPEPFGRTLWHERHVLAVLDAVNVVLYDQLGLLDDTVDRPRHGYQAVAYQLFRDEQSPDGSWPALLSALYASVAGMLGVNMQPVRFPGNCLLCWQTVDGSDSLFVSVMRGGLRQTREEIMASPYLRIRSVSPEWFEPVLRRQLLNRLVVGIMGVHRSAHLTDADLLSLNALAVWSEADCRLSYSLLYELADVFGLIRPMYTHGLIQEFLRKFGPTLTERQSEGLRDTMELMKQRYEQILQELRRHTEVVCLRRNAAPVQRRFRVGDIVHHRKYNYLAVVTGWTGQCDATESWIEQMGVDRLPLGRHQPFFHVLVEDNSTRYAADENLEAASEPCPIGHREMGRYFVRYACGRYVPLPALLERYPDPPAADADDGETSEVASGAARPGPADNAS